MGSVSLSVSVCGNGKGPDQWPFLQNMKVEHTVFRDSFMSLCVFFLTPVHDLDPKKCPDANILKDQYLGQIPGGKKKRKGKQQRENHFLAKLLEWCKMNTKIDDSVVIQHNKVMFWKKTWCRVKKKEKIDESVAEWRKSVTTCANYWEGFICTEARGRNISKKCLLVCDKCVFRESRPDRKHERLV